MTTIGAVARTFFARPAMWPDPSRTQQLLDQARGGTDAAVNRILEEFREPLRHMIRLRLDPALARRVDASDIVQEVLIEVSRRLPEYLRNPVMPFSLWLRQMARDRLIDAHRRHRQAQRRSLDREQALRPARLADHSSLELAAQFIDRELTPASAALRQEMQRRLEAALDLLDERDREILLLRTFEQLSNQEAA